MTRFKVRELKSGMRFRRTFDAPHVVFEFSHLDANQRSAHVVWHTGDRFGPYVGEIPADDEVDLVCSC